MDLVWKKPSMRVERKKITKKIAHIIIYLAD